MKKLILISLVLLISFACVGCEQESIKDKFIEPDGYTIVEIYQDGGIWAYGYINNEDLEKYFDKELTSLKILYPYKDKEQGRYVIIETKNVKMMSVGKYKEMRF